MTAFEKIKIAAKLDALRAYRNQLNQAREALSDDEYWACEAEYETEIVNVNAEIRACKDALKL